MSIHLCDRCGDVTLRGEGCTCATPYSLSEVRRRHRAAVASARSTAEREQAQGWVESSGYTAAVTRTTAFPAGPSSPGDEPAAPRRTAAAAFSGQRAQARMPGRDSMSRSGSGVSGAHPDAAAGGPDRLHASNEAPITTD